MAIYMIGNYPRPLTAAPVPVTTSTSLLTMLQVQASATLVMKVVEWGISFDGSSAATPGTVELIETDVAATVTAHAETGIYAINGDAFAGGNPVTNLIQVGVNATGFTATVEGTTLDSRVFDAQLIAPTNQYIKQFPLGREPMVQVGDFLRIRVDFAAAINALCYVVVELG